jgi:lysozyme
MIQGIDVSKYQGNIDWPAVAAAANSFAFARVSYGISSKDAFFADNWAGMKNAGIIRGAYQFFRASQDAQAQAELFVSTVQTLGLGDLPPVIDVENNDGGQSASKVIDGVAQWIETVESGLPGRQAIIYTGTPFWRDTLGNPTQFNSQPLWLAQYTSASSPNLPSAWSVWTFWQYSETGRVNGITGAVDLNRFNGELDRLRVLAGYPDESVQPGESTDAPTQ